MDDIRERDSDEHIAAQAVMFANRLEKQYKHLRKWARRTGVSAWRLYDKDIPEVPLAVDIYHAKEDAYLHIALYERPYEKDDEDERRWMATMREAAADVLSIPVGRVYTKIRKRQRGEESQYERLAKTGQRIQVAEGGSLFHVNLTDYLDTGLFLDHRPARLMVREQSVGKDVLNLFCYTGSFSVHAAAAGARSVCSVDLSKTYLAWAGDNLALNGYTAVNRDEDDAQKDRYTLVHADVKAFLARAKRNGFRWDLIICDPPTFSNSKRAVDTLDINRDWSELCRNTLALLKTGGTLYFSSNSRSLDFDPALIGGLVASGAVTIEDLTAKSIPDDFRNKKIHRLWRFTLKA